MEAGTIISSMLSLPKTIHAFAMDVCVVMPFWMKYYPSKSLVFDSVCFQNICKVALHLGILMSSELEMVLA